MDGHFGWQGVDSQGLYVTISEADQYLTRHRPLIFSPLFSFLLLLYKHKINSLSYLIKHDHPDSLLLLLLLLLLHQFSELLILSERLS